MKENIHHLNIHYSLPNRYWEKIKKVYTSMPGWAGYIDGHPHWFYSSGSDKKIWAAIEPGGLMVCCRINDQEWENWFKLFKIRLKSALGYEVKKPEYSYELLCF